MSEKSTMILVVLITGLLMGTCPGSSLAGEIDENCEFLKNTLDLVQKQGIEMATCATGFATPALRSRNALCIIKCALTKLGVLNSAGTINITGTLALAENIPPSMRESTMQMGAKCQQAIGKIVPNDETCHSYEEFVMCALGGVTSVVRGIIPKVLSGGGLRNILGLGKVVQCAGIAARLQRELLKLDLDIGGTLKRIF